MALALVDDPLAAWPFFVVMSGLCAPALTGAFACIARIGDDDEKPIVMRPFWAAYRRCFGKAVATWSVRVAVLSVLVLDAVVVADTSFGAALLPFFAVTSALVATTMAILVRLAEDSAARVRSLAQGVPGGSQVVLGPARSAFGRIAVVAVLAQPVLGMFLAVRRCFMSLGQT